MKQQFGRIVGILEAVEVKPVFAETVEEYEKELKEAARQEGKKEGAEEAAKAMAQRLLERGMSRDEVCEITGLSAEDVEAQKSDK